MQCRLFETETGKCIPDPLVIYIVALVIVIIVEKPADSPAKDCLDC